MRQIVLDTETTGLEPSQGHRIIEIGAVELINRRLTGNNFHQYLQPDRDIDAGAQEVHGITLEFLADKPRFHDVAQTFLDYIKGAELIIHNAPFDVGFINHEFGLLGDDWGKVVDHCEVIDTLVMARQLHPGQKNNLDALCKRYEIDNSHRDLHGALLDSEILADVYLAMTGGQSAMSFEGLGSSSNPVDENGLPGYAKLSAERKPLRVLRASVAELEAHQVRLIAIDKASGGECLWNKEVTAGN
ncbi:MAG: DNA polymerase III subunit epsilon [Gammaproteobacteria bacterium]|nr:DNA polymerase III subunit epsilon [Gammaproteobacteria bacterium]